MWKSLIKYVKYGTKLFKMVKPAAKATEEAASVGKSAVKETANVAKQEVKAAEKVAEVVNPTPKTEVVKKTLYIRKSDGARVFKKHYPERTGGIVYEGAVYDKAGKIVERSATYVEGSAFDRSANVITRVKTEFGGIVPPGKNQGQALRSTVTRIEASASSPRAEINIFKGKGMPQSASLNQVNYVNFAEKTVLKRSPNISYGVETPGYLPWATWK